MAANAQFEQSAKKMRTIVKHISGDMTSAEISTAMKVKNNQIMAVLASMAKEGIIDIVGTVASARYPKSGKTVNVYRMPGTLSDALTAIDTLLKARIEEKKAGANANYAVKESLIPKDATPLPYGGYTVPTKTGRIVRIEDDPTRSVSSDTIGRKAYTKAGGFSPLEII